MAGNANAKKTVKNDTIANNPNCQNFITYTVKNGPGKIIGIILMFVLSYLLHHLLRPLSQPRITSDIVVGLLIGNIPWIRDSFDDKFITTLNFVAEFGMICYLFVLGLEMDPYVIFKPPTREVLIAYAGMISTIAIACSLIPLMQFSRLTDLGVTISLSITLSGSSSHILTRMITNMKIGKSDIGKLVVAAGIHTDMISLLLISIGYVIVPPETKISEASTRLTRSLSMGAALLLQILFTAYVSPIFMNWVNNENPEGKPLKGSHLVLSIAFMALICSASTLYGYSPMLSAFMAGIFLPSEGRLTKWAVGKINYLLSIIFFPVFFFWMGFHANFMKFEPGNPVTWKRLFALIGVSIFGKVFGTVICGVIIGFHWRESAELGFLLTAKGHFHIFLAVLAAIYDVISISTSTIIIIAIFVSIVHAPFVVMQIIKRARKRAPTYRKALQWLDPSNELRILQCLQGPHNLPSTINFMEISKGVADPGILVYVTDMVELTDQIAATLVCSEGMDTVTVTDKAVTDMRDQISNVIQDYADEKGDGITIRRMLALSSFNGMAQDVCLLAEDLMVSLIILPFHKNQRQDKTLDVGHPGFRYVNRKVLRNAPCSVGILVDRGLGSINISKTSKSLLVAVLFIGGKDDREALAYASRVAQHPGVKLTVLRVLLDDNSENASRRGNYRVNVAEQEAEMKLDDECFAHFYERYVAGSRVAYMEKHVANSAETYTTLRSLEGQYALIIVGQGGRANSILTVGMNDWQQCPELGPVGDVLSGTEGSSTTSVLIIQQHSPKGQLDGVDDDFSIM